MSSPIVESVLSGSNRQLTRLAAQGLLPIAPEELIGVQVRLAEGDDEEMAALARASLEQVEKSILLPFLREQAAPMVLAWFAKHGRDRETIGTILRRKDVPAELLRSLAPRLPPELQEILLLRQDRISEEPEILEQLEKNPELSAFSRRRIGEYRAHLVGVAQRARKALEDAEEAASSEEESATALEDAEVARALEEAREEVPPEGEIDEVTGLSENQIKLLPIPVRLKLARGAPKGLRNLLLRDNSAQVALAVLASNPLSDQEIEQIARSRNVVDDVLEHIGQQRRWTAKYPIMHSLVSNPRTPINIALKFVPRLSVKDLRNLSRDRNVSEAVRAQARRLYKVKFG